MYVFPCQKCGLCCQHVYFATETQFLDRGDGVCKYYEAIHKECAIYAQRPEICQVDLQYVLRYKNLYTWDEYVALNLQACRILQENNNPS